MAETQLTHKLRNPKSYNEWMNIWTSHIDKEDGNIFYKIYPSSDWKIPVSLLTPNVVTENNEGQEIVDNETSNAPQSLPIGITVPVDRLIPIEGNTTSTLPDNIKITSNNISSDSNIFPIMTNSVAGIAIAGTGLIMDESTVNVVINQENINDIISNGIISKSKLNPEITIVGESSSSSDDNVFIIEPNTISINNLKEDLQDMIEEITVNRINSKLFGVGIGTAASPEAVGPLEEQDQWNSSDISKCGIWIQI